MININDKQCIWNKKYVHSLKELIQILLIQKKLELKLFQARKSLIHFHIQTTKVCNFNFTFYNNSDPSEQILIYMSLLLDLSNQLWKEGLGLWNYYLVKMYYNRICNARNHNYLMLVLMEKYIKMSIFHNSNNHLK